MTVYVDNMRARYGRMVMCHMLADDLDELHAMAERLGLKRAWFQDKGIPHYDISKGKRDLAIDYGAIPINRAQTVTVMRAWRRRIKLIRKAVVPDSRRA